MTSFVWIGATASNVGVRSVRPIDRKKSKETLLDTFDVEFGFAFGSALTGHSEFEVG